MENVLVTFPTTDEQKTQLQSLVPDWPITYSPFGDITADMIAKANIIIGNVPLEFLTETPALKWVQLFSSGAAEYGDVLEEEILLTCATGAYGTVVGEHSLALLLALMKHLPVYVTQKAEGIWKKASPARVVAGSTILVVGTGDLGASFARIVKSMGATVLGCKRTYTESIEGFDALYTIEELDTIIPLADVIVLALPGTESTHHLFNERRLRLMKQDAFLLNVGRGTSIDTEALCDVLNEGHIAAAALDVFEEEPIPEHHRLWDAPRLLVTPHVAGGLKAGNTSDRVFAICLENLRRYRDGKPLLHKVNRKTGYQEAAVHDRN